MRVWSLILLAVGIFLLAHSTFDEIRGITHQPYQWYYLRRRYMTHYYQIPVNRDQNPELFRKFMTTHWIYAALISGVGVALFVTSMPRKDE